MNNLIKSAAEDYYQKTGVSNYDYGALVTHFVTYLAAQGDAAIARSIIEASISTWYNQDDAEELLCKALAIGRAMNSWIPVSERLPEEDGHYLVIAPFSFPKNCKVIVAEFDKGAECFYSESSDMPVEDATHWQPLPELPKTEL